MGFIQILALVATSSFIFGVLAFLYKKANEPKKAVVLVKKSK